MAIPCAGCGRQYDVALFQFGRTIQCTCGARVGLETRLGPPVTADRPRFIADAMLGRLARWLRTLGFDTAYDAGISDAELVRRALGEERYILTRDRKLPEEWRIEGCLIVRAKRPLEQLAEVATAFGLEAPAHLFTRCRACNRVLVPADRDAVARRVPPRVIEREAAFVQCPACHRIYWEGSHTDRMRAVIARVFGGARAPRPNGGT
jgi:uncharacterized protein with PIN domain